MPAGDPAALEESAAEVGRYASQVGDLAAATRKSVTGITADGDWTGSAASAFTAYTGGLSSGVAGMEQPLGRVPAAVAGYAAALRTAQARVDAYQSYASQVAAFTGPVSGPVTAAQAQAEAQALRSSASDALAGLERAAQDAAGLLQAIAETLERVFDDSGPFHSWLEKVARPWDAAGGDAWVEAAIGRAEKVEEDFDKELEAAKDFMKDLPGKLTAQREKILGGMWDEVFAEKADLAALTPAIQRLQTLRDAMQGFGEAAVKADPPLLARLLPGLKGLGILSGAATAIGGAYYLAAPPDYDHGAMRVATRGAGIASILGGAEGVAANAGVEFAGGSLIPGVGEAVAVGAGLYLTGDYIYHNTHQIAHTFDTARHATAQGLDVARHTAAHYADDVVSWL